MLASLMSVTVYGLMNMHSFMPSLSMLVRKGRGTAGRSKNRCPAVVDAVMFGPVRPWIGPVATAAHEVLKTVRPWLDRCRAGRPRGPRRRATRGLKRQRCRYSQLPSTGGSAAAFIAAPQAGSVPVTAPNTQIVASCTESQDKIPF